MESIYLDNSATSFPKAPGVSDAMKYYLDTIGCNVKRGVYSSSISAEETVFDTRERLCKLFNFDAPENAIFTMNITASINYLLKGLLKPGDHAIVSSMEHNAVMRPLVQLEKTGVKFSRVPCSTNGELDVNSIDSLIKPNTKAVVMTHASNVCGTILPIKEVGQICKERGLIFIVDAAQTAGILDIDFSDNNIDALAFTGHKGLLGPQGIGGFLVKQELAETLDTLVSGGTGSLSDSEEIPPFMPDKFEPGTPNIPGIFGLNAALKYIEEQSIDNIRRKEMELTDLFLDGVKSISGVEIIGMKNTDNRLAVVSLNFKSRDNGEIAYKLDKDYKIMTRCGLHCAPNAHKTLGTYPFGTVRFSFSHFNTKEQVEYGVEAIKRV